MYSSSTDCLRLETNREMENKMASGKILRDAEDSLTKQTSTKDKNIGSCSEKHDNEKANNSATNKQNELKQNITLGEGKHGSDAEQNYQSYSPGLEQLNKTNQRDNDEQQRCAVENQNEKNPDSETAHDGSDGESKCDNAGDYKSGVMFDSLHGFDEITDEDNDTSSQDSVFITHNPAFISSITSWTSEMQDEMSQSQMTDSTASIGGSTGTMQTQVSATWIEPHTGAKPKMVSGSPKHGVLKRGAASPKLRRAAQRPETLSIQRSVVLHKRQAGKTGEEGAIEDHSPLEGMIEKEGEMISFIAKDLEEKIKMSSPLSKQEGKPFCVFIWYFY